MCHELSAHYNNQDDSNLIHLVKYAKSVSVDIPHSLNLGVRIVFDCCSVFAAFVVPTLFVLQSFLLQSGWLRGCLSFLRSSSVVSLSLSSDGNFFVYPSVRFQFALERWRSVFG